jgi:DNA-binding transcriptional MocR family regulator
MNARDNTLPAPLTRDAGTTLVEQLAQRIAERIVQRLLPAGTRLPSVRESARRHGLSPSTVVAAYDLLLARGLVESRPQRGFFVRAPRPASRGPVAALRRESGDDGKPPQPIDATALIRGMFRHGTREATPGMGTLPAGWLDLPLLHAMLRRAMRDEARGADPRAGASAAGGMSDRDGAASADDSLHYGAPMGDVRLRASLASRLADLGIAADPAQIVTAVGATHALDLVARTLLRPGDAVLVDDPGWAVEYARLSRMGMRLLPVPRGLEGPDLDVMRTLLAQHRPRLYVTVSVLHNPTGACLSAAAAHRVLQLAQASELTIVEDDTYAHLADAHLPRLAALDGLERTIVVGGFSKIVAPGWRVGFLAAPRRFVDAIVDSKLLAGLTSPWLLERAMAHALDSGALRRHAERVRARLDAARTRTQKLATDTGCRFVTPPQGPFGWVDTGVDTERLAQAMLDDGWLLAPGRLFHVDARPTTTMRVNFATSQDAKFWRAFERAVRSLGRAT